MTYTVGPKGQVVIAKEIRDRLGVGPGWVALQRIVADHVEVSFAPPSHTRSLKGSLARHIKTRVLDGDYWRAAKESAWSTAARKRDKSKAANSD